jgi:hypothetical protein
MELAKAQNELRCAEADLAKSKNRIAFTLSAIHSLKDRDLEVIAVFFPEYWDVIHVMPVKLRERKSGGYRGANW